MYELILKFRLFINVGNNYKISTLISKLYKIITFNNLALFNHKLLIICYIIMRIFNNLRGE